jgi:hypothetical protein
MTVMSYDSNIKDENLVSIILTIKRVNSYLLLFGNNTLQSSSWQTHLPSVLNRFWYIQIRLNFKLVLSFYCVKIFYIYRRVCKTFIESLIKTYKVLTSVVTPRFPVCLHQSQYFLSHKGNYLAMNVNCVASV